MRISISCGSCASPKRPLSACPACGAAPAAATELHDWRRELHAYGIARITDTPAADPLPAEREWSTEGLTVVLVLDAELQPERGPAQIVPFEAPLSAEDALSFDWEDERPRRLRRSA